MKNKILLSLILVSLIFGGPGPVFSMDVLRPPVLCGGEDIGRRKVLQMLLAPFARPFEKSAAFLDRDTMLKLGFAPDKIDSIYARFADKKLRKIMEGFQKGMDAIGGLKGNHDRYAVELLELSRKVFLELKNNGYLFDIGRSDSIMKLLVNAVSPDKDIFEIIENNQGLTQEGRQYLVKEIAKCSPRSQLAIMILKTMLNSGPAVKGAMAPNHSFSVIDMGGNRYLFIDFSLGLFIDTKLDEFYAPTTTGQKPEYIGKYWFLRNELKLSLDRTNLFRNAFKEGGTDKLIKSCKPTIKELLAFFYPTLHIAETDSANQNGFISSSAASIHISRSFVFSFLGEVSSRDYFEDVKAECRSAIRMDPYYAENYVNMGSALISQQRYREALPYLEKARDIDPASAGAHLNLGVSYAELGRWDEAIVEEEAAIALDDSVVIAYTNLGNSYIKRLKYDKAQEVFQRGIEKIPEDFSLRYGLGKAYFGDKKYEKAVDAFKEAIKIDHNSWEPWLGLGMSYYNMPGRRNEAIDSFVNAVILVGEIRDRDEVIKTMPADILKEVIDKIPVKISQKVLAPLYVGSMRALQSRFRLGWSSL